MSGGNSCTGLVAAVPLEYITDFLALDKKDQRLSFCIIRNDGSVVVNNSNIGLEDSSQRLPEPLSSYDESATAYSVESFDDALQNNRSYVSTIAFNGEEQTLHSTPLSHSEWNLIFDFEKAPAMEVDMVLPAWNMLMVDDDELLCKSTIDVLKGFGIHTEWTLSGEDAIALAIERHEKRNDYQIILLDWKLPGMNGIQVAKELRSHLGKEIPILLISAYDWSDFEAEAREAGIDGFISKPLFKSTLFYNLHKYMGLDESSSQPQELSTALSRRRILLAEDNELNWEIASELLSDLGLELEWAEDGQICLEKFEKSPAGYYDFILMDIRMPHMTGYEATQAIRKSIHPDAASVPIIAMSADAFAEDVQRCLDCGMNAHIAKPIDITEVTKLLERFLK